MLSNSSHSIYGSGKPFFSCPSLMENHVNGLGNRTDSKDSYGLCTAFQSPPFS